MNFQTNNAASSDFQHQESQKYKESIEKSKKYQNELDENLKKALRHPLLAENITSVDGASEMKMVEYL